MTTKKFTLGRGLGALIEDADTTSRSRPEGIDLFAEIDIDRIVVNPYQPRKDFAEEALEELTASIRKLGVIQPITVRKSNDGTFQIVAGERRVRASKLAGLTKIPAYIRTATDQAMMEMALVENIQRDDLNAIEIALSFQQLLDHFHLTQEQLSDRVGKNRATVANYIRLLRLPSEIQLGIRDRAISMGHARALLSFDDPEMQINVYRSILEESYSVRRVEEMARTFSEEPAGVATMPAKPTPKASEPLPQRVAEAKALLSKILSAKVEIKVSPKGSGKLSIPFSSEEELAQIMQKINR